MIELFEAYCLMATVDDLAQVSDFVHVPSFPKDNLFVHTGSNLTISRQSNSCHVSDRFNRLKVGERVLLAPAVQSLIETRLLGFESEKNRSLPAWDEFELWSNGLQAGDPKREAVFIWRVESDGEHSVTHMTYGRTIN